MRLFTSLVLTASCFAWAPAPQIQRTTEEVFAQEQRFLERLAAYSPVVETYVQEVDVASEVAGGTKPLRDHYFLGRARYQARVDYESLLSKPAQAPQEGKLRKVLGSRGSRDALQFLPKGFAQMAVLDVNNFDAEHYRLEPVRREFVGEIRCVVFDVVPTKQDSGRFVGRIWTDERDASIVRFNGTYLRGTEPSNEKNKASLYLHFESWRTNPSPGLWIPSHVYVEEESGSGKDTRFKALTRFWDYNHQANRMDEHTDLVLEDIPVAVNAADADTMTPLEGQKAWERQAEDNIISRLERGGLLAAPGPVDEILNGVVENLMISAKLHVNARCRVLLTTPFESFSIGGTIVISRGLLDVLPDETSLALVLADELSHIELAHRTPTQFAFYNQTMLSDAELLASLRLNRTDREMEEASKKTVEIIRASAYQQAGSAGLFLKAVASRGAVLPRLLSPNLGNQLSNTKTLSRLASLMDSAPVLDESKIEQIAALPLGSRVKLNSWNNEVSLIPPKPIKLISAREKMPFEIAPYFEYLRLTPVSEPHN